MEIALFKILPVGDIQDNILSLKKESSLFKSDTPVQRLYLGSEYCIRLLPSITEIENNISFCHSNGLSFTLVTPAMVTDTDIPLLKQIFHYLNTKDEKTEIVINDWGILALIQEFPQLLPILGRLLNKREKDPRINYHEKPEEVKQLFQSTILDHTPLCSYLEQKRVIGIEFDNYFYPINLKLNHHSFHCHIYYPLVFSSLSRICVFAGTYKDEKKKFVINSHCEKECIRYFIQRQFQKGTTQNAFMTAQVGKGIYCENKDEPKNLNVFKRCIITTL